jgi:molybdopterin-containing oxidoreductase family membrane subunit
MRPAAGVLGISREEKRLAEALARLRRSGYANVETFSPVPSEELLTGPKPTPSPIRMYTLVGGILGLLSGLFLTIWTSMQWQLITGGKPVASIPAFLVVVFELTVLFGGLFTLAGWLIHSGFGRPIVTAVPGAARDPRFSIDHFGILVACESNQIEEVKRLILAAGVEEVSVATV